MTEFTPDVDSIITSRKSVRGFLPKSVPLQTIEEILSTSSFAPSGSNIQPWKVHIISGETHARLSVALLAAHFAHTPESRDYDYYPSSWRSPYIERRRATGWSLYSSLGIAKGDRIASLHQHARNFEFFGAPIVLIFTIDKDLNKGSWLDYGMFLQNIMISAMSRGLGTCPQAALASYPKIVREELGISATEAVVCGISIGYEDPDCPANGFRTSRIALDEFVTIHR